MRTATGFDRVRIKSDPILSVMLDILYFWCARELAAAAAFLHGHAQEDCLPAHEVRSGRAAESCLGAAWLNLIGQCGALDSTSLSESKQPPSRYLSARPDRPPHHSVSSNIVRSWRSRGRELIGRDKGLSRVLRKSSHQDQRRRALRRTGPSRTVSRYHSDRWSRGQGIEGPKKSKSRSIRTRMHQEEICWRSRLPSM